MSNVMSIRQDCLAAHCLLHRSLLTPDSVPRSRLAIRCCSGESAAVSATPSSARERRKERNERRQQQKTSWREVVEEKLSERTKVPTKGLKYELDMTNRITARGMQWWMVLVPMRQELFMAEDISAALTREFPDEDIEVYVPSVPSKRKLKDGSMSPSTRRLHSGCVFLRCVLTRRIHDAVRRVPRVRGFFGKKVDFYKVTMPTPVSLEDIEGIRRKVREEESDFERLKELANEEIQMKLVENKMASEKDLPISIGSNIRVVGGPYANFEGCVTGLPDEDMKVQAEVTVFGELQNLVLALDEIEVLSS